jgi:hypothetical protein
VIQGDLEYVSWYSDGVRVVDLSDPGRPREVASFVPPSSPPRQTAATAQNGRRDMPVVWGVYPWKDLVLASDMNSGLWVIRVTADTARSDQGGSGSGGSGQAVPGRGAAPGPEPPLEPAADPGVAIWVGLAGLALGLLAVGAVVRSAAHRRQSG